MIRPPPSSPLFPNPTLSRSAPPALCRGHHPRFRPQGPLCRAGAERRRPPRSDLARDRRLMPHPTLPLPHAMTTSASSSDDSLVLYGQRFDSRLLLGTSRYPSPAVLEAAVQRARDRKSVG